MGFDFSKTGGLALLKHRIAPDMSDEEFVVREIKRHRGSKAYRWMQTGERYYLGDHDILKRERKAIGEDGRLVTLHNAPNARLVNNQYNKLVTQKANYLVGNPFTLQIDDEVYSEELGQIFDRRFHRLLNLVTVDALNCGVGWVYIYYNEQGELAFKRLDPCEVIPGWGDDERTQLDYLIRVYPTMRYTREGEEVIEHVEVYDDEGIRFFTLEDNRLRPEEPYEATYLIDTEQPGSPGLNWARIPVVPFRHNAEEVPLIRKVKGLQDALNELTSDFKNVMQEDGRNTILVIRNYDGADLGEFRHNLNAFSAVKVSNDGGVDSIKMEVNSGNYESIIQLLKQAIIENGMGYDAKDDRLTSGAPNQMNIRSMYSDVDLDANAMETEYQAAFENLLWFVDCHLANIGHGDFEHSDVEVIFNRDMMVNESETIDNLTSSMGLLSRETLVSQHPWVVDADAELERLAAEEAAAQQLLDPYSPSFGPGHDHDHEQEEDE